MTTPCIIRRATPADRPALAEIFLKARRAAFDWQDPASFALDDFDAQTEGEIILLAENTDGLPLGFVSVWEPDGFIHHLFVDPAHQGEGIGSLLLDDLHAWLLLPYRLKCLARNTRALAFYAKRGWRQVEDEGGRGNEGRDDAWILLEYAGPAKIPQPQGENENAGPISRPGVERRR